MNPSYKLRCLQKSQLKMNLSLSMQQSLQILQMPIEELKTWLDQAITANPFLEWNEEALKSSSKPFYSTVDVPYLPSLFSHLINQAQIVFKDPLLLKIAEWILGNLEPTGFFMQSFDSIPFPCKKSDWDLCLSTIKQLDPPGIGAKDIQESLLLQLEALEKQKSLAFQIIEQNFDLLLERKTPSLQKLYKLSKEDLQKAFLEISSLDPYPGFRYHTNPTPSLPVDVIFLQEELEVVNLPLPFLASISFEKSTPEEKTACKELQIEAKQIIDAVQKRNITLQKVSTYLVKKQRKYLSGELDTLIPLNIQTIALELQLHESTVARAIANKNLFSPRGVIPLKSLLSKKLSGDISSDQAKKLLKRLIQEENKKNPLSDEELLEKLRNLGIPCARRTVTKYRKSLHIPSKWERRNVVN